MENLPIENALRAEREKRETDTSILEGTEGFPRLTERQQRIIRQSLYIQARAERGTDYASASAIESPKSHATDKVRIINEVDLERYYADDLGPNPNIRKYKTSQNHIVNWYCHAAIANLESEGGLTAEPESLPDSFLDSFFATEYRTIESLGSLQTWLEQFGFPAVIHVNIYKMSQHSALALGHNENGRIIVWDKEGYQLPYRVTSLENLYEGQDEGSSWGLRKLRVAGSE